MYHQSNNESQDIVSKRIHVTLPDRVYQRLEGWADSEGRPVANLAAYLLQKIIEEAEGQGKIPEQKMTKGK